MHKMLTTKKKVQLIKKLKRKYQKHLNKRQTVRLPIGLIKIVLEENKEDNCILPAGVSAHTENVHFLKTDVKHFYLKVMAQGVYH